MKKKIFFPAIFFLSVISFCQIIAAHTLAPVDCYTIYKNRGDSLNKIGNYDQAIAQYQAAKYCAQVSVAQKKTLDGLIADVNRKKQISGTKKVITRKF
ncbi:MAG: hypothetical protein ABIN89_12640 [Chitinophagaceae bacterium]